MTLRWSVLGPMSALAGLLLVSAACGPGPERSFRVSPGALRSPVAGYDPAWSLDGTHVAYVEATYVRRGDYGLLLDNDHRTPTPRDTIRLWDLHTGKSRRLRPAAARGTFITSLAWIDGSTIAFLASDMHKRTPQMPSETGSDWDMVSIYRILLKDLILMNTKTGDSWVLATGGRWPQMERASMSDGSIAVWECVQPGADKRSFAVTFLARDGTEMRQWRFPPGRWQGLAVGTVRTELPAMVRQQGAQDFRLSVIDGRETRDIYRARGLILGVFGSPGGGRVAFLEEVGGLAPGAQSSLRVLPLDGRRPVAVADDAFGESRVAWSPDARRIAYVRSHDGHIVIADVPPIP